MSSRAPLLTVENKRSKREHQMKIRILMSSRLSLLVRFSGIGLEPVTKRIRIDSQVPLCENAVVNFQYHMGHPRALMAASASIEVCTSFSLNSLWNCVGRESGGPSSMISRMALVRPIERRFFKRRTRLKAT